MKPKQYFLERKNKATGRIWTARCEQIDDKYILKAGSIISDIELEGMSNRIKALRDSAPINEDRALMSDICFDNLSDAASFVLATNASGEREWKERI